MGWMTAAYLDSAQLHVLPNRMGFHPQTCVALSHTNPLGATNTKVNSLKGLNFCSASFTRSAHSNSVLFRKIRPAQQLSPPSIVSFCAQILRPVMVLKTCLSPSALSGEHVPASYKWPTALRAYSHKQ